MRTWTTFNDTRVAMLFYLYSTALVTTLLSFSRSVSSNRVPQRSANEEGGYVRERRQFARVATVIPDEVKDEFKKYAKSYLNSVVTELSKKSQLELERPVSSSNPAKKSARICAEVCQHRCLPSCEWTCCIKENIEEYRTAHLVKPFGLRRRDSRPSARKDIAAKADNTGSATKRAHFARLGDDAEPVFKDGGKCEPSCKRLCLPSCRFACCQAVQVKGVMLF